MNKGIKNTGISFIAVAILTILFHSIIPHHHHTDSIFSHFDKNCNTSKHNSGGEDNATHCHAFNELAIDKISHNTNLNTEFYGQQNEETEIPVPLSLDSKTAVTNEKRESIFTFLFKRHRGPPLKILTA